MQKIEKVGIDTDDNDMTSVVAVGDTNISNKSVEDRCRTIELLDCSHQPAADNSTKNVDNCSLYETFLNSYVDYRRQLSQCSLDSFDDAWREMFSSNVIEKYYEVKSEVLDQELNIVNQVNPLNY